MNKRLIVLTFCIVFVLVVAFQLKGKFNPPAEETFSKNEVRYGATGADVNELQGRLKFIGFYSGSIDGDYGYKTLLAVKRFQGEFGMKVDGVVGPKTKLKLWEATKNWKPTAPTTAGQGSAGNETATSNQKPANLLPSNNLGLSEQDINLMANAVHGEARGEPYIGQVAVAAVILNRVKSASFPNTVSGVIFQPGAFTAVADGQIWLTPNESTKKAVKDALNGWDPTGGCIYYFNPVTATSKWIWSRPQVKNIGKHIFCK
ncbi:MULTISPECIES: spore cortex-lytic enzyme [unclassified Paenibacillus]|uniref:spore cortex-lytic enzyme n=1 Tax=unclassified Paenibacillus TaxID=185978 RepID=UPI00070F6E8B|nr:MULTISPECIES: spore cortex-lytic enzyme [unclassified Paenibacillus]KQX69132.1 spore cortex-lytic enzyme [Paenibacillus sp. Root444D2]KRE51678.1 spore cortex-lytic enzyme [Paenibacillus sp. Soil724D2]